LRYGEKLKKKTVTFVIIVAPSKGVQREGIFFLFHGEFGRE